MRRGPVTPDRIHLVSSVAPDSVEEVFRTAGTVLGRRLRRVPDSEPGGRRLWIGWQYPFLRGQAFLRPDTSIPNPRGLQPLMLAENVDWRIGARDPLSVSFDVPIDMLCGCWYEIVYSV